MTLEQILKLIRGARKSPAERDSFYNILRTFDDEPRSPIGAPQSRGAVAAA